MKALILAGSRHGQEDNVAKAAGVACKAFAPIHSIPMIDYVIGAIQKTKLVSKIYISLPDNLPLRDDVERINSENSPVKSIKKALDFFGDHEAFLITTADHALITPLMIETIIGAFDQTTFDVVVAMVPLDIVSQKYPTIKRTKLNFKNASYKSCNLFIFKNKKAAQNILEFWQHIENLRKTPWKMIRTLGPWTLLQYVTGHLSLKSAFAAIGQKTATNPQIIMLDIPEAAIDVDTVQDYEFVKDILSDSQKFDSKVP